MSLGTKIVAGTVAGLACTGLAGLGLSTQPGGTASTANAQLQSAITAGKPDKATDAKPAGTQPEPETRTLKVTEPIAHDSRIQNDPQLPTGQSRVVSPGADGERVVTYQVTYRDGKEVRRQSIKADITRQPVPHVTTVGSKTTPKASTTATPTAPSVSSPD